MYYFGPFCLDPERLVLYAGSKPLALGPKVVETLLAFAERPGEVLTKVELLDRIWPQGYVEESNLAQNVYVLRKVLRAHWRDVIETLPRRGYRFAAVPSRVPGRSRSRSRYYFAAAAALVVLAFSFGLLHDTARSRPQPVALSSEGARALAIGTYYWKQRTQSGLHLSIRYFNSVIASDPKNARGYAALAQAYALLGNYMYAPMKPSYARAHKLAIIALRLDPRSAEAHAAVGLSEDLPATRRAALAQYRQAVLLDPNYASAHQWYGSSLLQQGRVDDGLHELRTAAQLDPVSPAGLSTLSEAAYFARRYPEAIAYARQTTDLAPRRPNPYISMGMSYEALRNYRAAEQAYRELAVACPSCAGQAAALLAHVYAVAGNRARAAAEIAVAKKTKMVDSADIAVALIAMNRREEALDALRRSMWHEEGATLALDPRLDPVRRDPRFRRYVTAPA
jgi:DNA-binding winged helix-turn-helix (wHTH) protein/Tfp pilus assembly protein PilF